MVKMGLLGLNSWVRGADMLKKPVAWWIGATALVLLVLGALTATMVFQIKLAAAGHVFTSFEQTAFSIAQLVFSILISGFISWFLTTVGSQAEHQRFAKAAIRRVEGFYEGLERLNSVVHQP